MILSKMEQTTIKPLNDFKMEHLLGKRRKKVADKSRVHTMSVDWDYVFKRSVVSDDRQDTDYTKQAVEVKKTKFNTGSTYTGQWNQLGMCGFGYYAIFHGVDYEGMLDDSMFHGIGIMQFPSRSKLEGEWRYGRMIPYDYCFSDTKYHGAYCEMPDRRFFSEIQVGLQPAGRSFKTNLAPSRTIPAGCYDTGDGFYNPKTKCVTDPMDKKKIIRIPTKKEHDWIIKHCRKAWDEPAGYRPDFYENWFDPEIDQAAVKGEDSSHSDLKEPFEMVKDVLARIAY